jgi:type II secretory pathway pseudopilin PulG
MMKFRLTDEESGFTLVELVVAMGLTLVVTTVVLNYAIDFWGNAATLQNDSASFIDRNNAGDRVRDALNVATGLILQNSLADANPMKPDPSDGTGQYWLPIHAIPGNTVLPAAGGYTPLFYFQAPATDSGKNLILNGTNPYENEFIMYLDGTTKQILMRSLANSGASGNAVQTSCPAAAVTASCPADKVIANNVASVDMRYFSRSGNTIDYTSITDPLTGAYIGPDFTAVEVVEMNVHEAIKSTIHGGQDTSNQTIIRVALRNG